MKEKLAALVARFVAMSMRERAMIAGALVVGIVMIGITLFVDPPTARLKTMRAAYAQQQAELQGLQQQVAAMRAQMTDPDAANRQALASAKKELASLDERVRGAGAALVSANQMPQLLQGLLKQHKGLRLVSMRSLPAMPLTAGKEAKPAAAKPEDAAKEAAAGTEAKSLTTASSVYRHGVELKIEGGYLDLLAYVSELERLPQRMLWQQVQMSVGEYPRSTLTIKVYTLSLEKVWLSV